MSLDATRWAWQQCGVRSSGRLVLLALADRAGEMHECYPSISRLVADTELDRKTVLAVIARLEEMGLIQVDREPGRTSMYRLIGVADRHGDDGGRRLRSRQINTENGTGRKNGQGSGNGTGRKNGSEPGGKTGPTPGPKTGHKSTNESIKNLRASTPRACVGSESDSLEGVVERWFGYRAVLRSRGLIAEWRQRGLGAGDLERIIGGIKREQPDVRGPAYFAGIVVDFLRGRGGSATRPEPRRSRETRQSSVSAFLARNAG